MNHKKYHIKIDSTLLALSLILALGLNSAWAENIDPANDGSQYAWGENVGWINFQPTSGPGVTVTDSVVIGKAWGENIGWLNLNPATGGVINDGSGNLSGKAWGENIGWVNFNPNFGGVIVDPVTGEFSGKAWGENTGWIAFRATGDGVPFGVTTGWQEVVLPPVTKCDCNNDGAINIADIQKIFSARGTLVNPTDPRDANSDGIITVGDGRACVLKCDNPKCAP